MRLWLALLLMAATPLRAAENECAWQPAAHEEPWSLPQSGGRAVRDNDVLRLATDRGPVKLRDTDCEDGPSAECRQYRFISFLWEQGFYLVSVSFYEGGAYRLVDVKTGKATDIWGFPEFSPDGTRFVTSGRNDSYDFNVVEVWRLSNKGPAREVRLTFPYEPPGEISYCFKHWIDPRHVALWGTRWRGEGIGEPEDLLETFPATLIRTGRGWRVRRGD